MLRRSAHLSGDAIQGFLQSVSHSCGLSDGLVLSYLLLLRVHREGEKQVRESEVEEREVGERETCGGDRGWGDRVREYQVW